MREGIKRFLLESALEGCSGVHSFAIDITGNTKKHSHKSEDYSAPQCQDQFLFFLREFFLSFFIIKIYFRRSFIF